MLFKSLIAAALAGLALAAPVEVGLAKRDFSRKMRWFGVNLSGAEFNPTILPGVNNVDYTWYDLSKIDQFIAQGMNIFRINFPMERLTPGSLTAGFDQGNLDNLTQTVNYITSRGAYAMVQAHNFGRFYGQVITDEIGFKTWWKNVAGLFKDNSLVVFDINNEFHDMDMKLLFELNQQAIWGIRDSGATSQWITAEGTDYSAAYTWVSAGNGAQLVGLNDPQNKLIYQMHQYLDQDNSGSHDQCVSATIFADRLQAPTKWLRDNGKQGVIGEFAGGTNDQCTQAIKGGLQYLKDNGDVWFGAMWWASGPWWGDYMFSMEPTNGNAWNYYLPIIRQYFVY